MKKFISSMGKISLLLIGSLLVINSNLNAWSAPQQISTNDASSHPAVSVDPSGNIVAAWISGNAPFNKIQTVGYSQATQTWSLPVNITENGLHSDVSVGIDKNGTATAIWVDDTNNIQSIQYSRRKLNGQWSNPKIISQTKSNSHPVLAVDPKGNGIAAWILRDDDKIVAARLANGVWGLPYVIWSQGGNIEPELTINGQGNVILSWFNIGKNSTLSSTYVNNVWSQVQVIDKPARNGNSNNPITKSKAAVALNENGSALAVWSDYSSGVKSTFNSIYTQPWNNPQLFLSTVFPNTLPNVVLGDSGNAVSIWLNTALGLVQSSSLQNGSWSSPVAICNSYNNSSCKLISNKDEIATAVWVDLDGSIIKTSSIHPNGFWSYPPTAISNTGYNDFPVLAGNANGQSAVLWIHNIGNNNVIQASVN